MTLSQSLMDRGRMGLITLDQDRNVEACFGTLMSWIPFGSRASETIPFLAGLDDVFDEIDKGERSFFSLPRVSLRHGDMAEKILSLEVMPSESQGKLQILVRDETELAGLEQNILQQRNELALANGALAEAKQRAEAAFREKSAFLANISHDLKTPLQVIMGNAEILRGDLPESEREAFLQDVLENSNFLLALITDLLEASTLEAGQLELNEESIDVNALLERVVAMTRQMPGGGDRLFDLCFEDATTMIVVDPMRLQRLLLNVMSNAVKFTEKGGRIAVKAGSVEGGDFIIQVEDDGPGIQPDMMERVFEPFVRSHLTEGSGLGLHIAKGLADLHEAGFDLVSTPGVGTTVKLLLPNSRVLSASR